MCCVLCVHVCNQQYVRKPFQNGFVFIICYLASKNRFTETCFGKHNLWQRKRLSEPHNQNSFAFIFSKKKIPESRLENLFLPKKKKIKRTLCFPKQVFKTGLQKPVSRSEITDDKSKAVLKRLSYVLPVTHVYITYTAHNASSLFSWGQRAQCS